MDWHLIGIVVGAVGCMAIKDLAKLQFKKKRDE